MYEGKIEIQALGGGRPAYKGKYLICRRIAIGATLIALGAIVLIVCLTSSNIRLRQELATFTNAPVIPGKVAYEIKSDYRRRK